MPKPEQFRAIFAECGISAALEAVGERWSFLILRGAFNGLHHFEQFQSTLGIARNILSNRLARLVEHGILRRDPDPADRGRKVDHGGICLRGVWVGPGGVPGVRRGRRTGLAQGE